MEQTNLAAEILRCADSRSSPRKAEGHYELTHESVLDLADWLQRESSINAWRSICVAPAYLDQPTPPVSEPPSIGRFKRR
jgi:hypothetical protein